MPIGILRARLPSAGIRSDTKLPAPAARIIVNRMMASEYVGWPRYTENRCRNGIWMNMNPQPMAAK